MAKSRTTFAPNLAAKLKKGQKYEDVLPKLDWDRGQLLSPKLDGFRIAIEQNLGPVTRSLLKVANVHTRKLLDRAHKEGWITGFDGELVVGDHESTKYTFQKTSSALTSFEGRPKITFHVFDDFTEPQAAFKHRVSSYVDRIKTLHIDIGDDLGFEIRPVPQIFCQNLDQAYRWEQQFLERHYEGLMGRHVHSKYKYGRSTWREQGLWALKRFVDCEAKVIGFEPLMRNMNEPTIDELGYQKRSSHQDNKVADDLCGKLLCVGLEGTPFEGIEFSIGSGMTEAMRRQVWAQKDFYLGMSVKFKYQPVGVKEKPRAPIFLGFRPKEDM